jgi:hypothetical protein
MVSRYENGVTPPSLQYIKTLLEHLDPVDTSLAARLRKVSLGRGSEPFDEGRARSAELLRFLGTATTAEPGIALVYPTFEFSDAASEALQKVQGHLYDKPHLFDLGRGTGVLEPVAANDIRALCTVAKLLSREGVSSYMISDTDAERDGANFPAVSFGLASNEMVFVLLDVCAQQSRPWPFRPVVIDGKPAVEVNGHANLSYEGNDRGIVARFTPDPSRPDRRWLFCAGVGPAGTEAAALFLDRDWQGLSTTVGDDDFVTVVRCKAENPAILTQLGEPVMIPRPAAVSARIEQE